MRRQLTKQTAYPYITLFQAGEKLLEEAQESKDEEWRREPALLALFASFEGFLNTLGEILLPADWAEATKVFGQDPYRGTIGKYKKLAEHLGLPEGNPGRRPHQTVRQLKGIRNELAHSRPEEGSWEEALKLSPVWRSTKLQQRIARTGKHVVKDLIWVCRDLWEKANERFPGQVLIPPV